MDNQNVSNNMTQQPVQYYGESDEQKAKRAGVFAFMWLPTILYAVFYTFCLYNTVSFTSPNKFGTQKPTILAHLFLAIHHQPFSFFVFYIGL